MTHQAGNTSFDVSPPSPSRSQEIVVGLDESPAAAAALRWAAEQARLTGTALRVVHTWQLSALEVESASATYWQTADTDARARATREVHDALGSESPGVRWTLDVVEGVPGPVLVAAAERARLLVLGTHEHTGLRRAVLGSVSHYCLSHALTPVVAVPASV